MITVSKAPGSRWNAQRASGRMAGWPVCFGSNFNDMDSSRAGDSARQTYASSYLGQDCEPALPKTMRDLADVFD